MEIYINENLIVSEDITDKKDILELVESKLEDEIIDKIHLDQVEVSLKYFQENELDLDRIDKIKFESKKVEQLITETLKEAENYLPKLKKASNNSAELFKNGKEADASDLLDKTLEGIQWYLEVVNGILSLIDNEELKDKGNKILSDFTQALNRAMVALQNENYDYLGDLLEVEMMEYLDKLSDFNQELLEEN
ncbi:hypothetical protein SAMN04488598_12428 [Halanaerobium congolense]|uniref:DUF8042 domain-containing protein n=1 Tax=Halanaerobium congolense TaxID=54121 RepID=A0A1I0BNP9_9FIRM|nr:hypothetical protein [Halanaerobium congolense]PTX16479.1 hypothetical protein C7953_1198 [Halanaerobium congolense]SDF78193.1 hypothetical protein SAMN04488598_12428 [Halanaerobium congolense]SET08607.1 hypothetical protein SAMN04515652_12428 [Halanaerobium congolense]SFP50487.1 hypothetical protein SAMN04488596_12428 [Halanaerobium congolense]